MAEATVHLALNKLAEAAVTETLRLYGAGGQLDSLQHELRWIQAFLKDAEAKKHLDHRAMTWVSEVRDMAYRIEDVIDTFMAEVDDYKNRQGVINALKQVLRNPKKLPIVRKLTSEMDAIENRLQKIQELTERYGINKKLSSSSVPPRRPIRGVMLPDEDDRDVVGLEADKEEIVNRLLDQNTPRRRVVAIVGQGGLGKTTLAKKAYNSDKVKREFGIRVWLSISQQFELINVLSMMLEGVRPLNQDEKELLKDLKSQPRATQHFARHLNSLLKQKRYLIIMDDVWTPDLWDQVKDVLPNTENGSRVLITTRISNIATKADSTCDPHNMRYLSAVESQELLLKNAFPFQDPKAYLHGLSDLPKKFARKCGNLPLALKIVGGRLSRELPTYNSWHKILQKLNWHDGDEKNCTDILATSYEDTPAYLKPCFLYFALYPEDYQIEVEPLIRMWVSEGFIPEKNGTTMEETAEDYLEELALRSMIQVVKRHYNGSIKYCRIHDLLRDLAIEKAKENNFLQIISNQESFCNFLNEIPQLTSLNLEYYSAPYERLEMSFFPSYNHMQSLRVFGEWNNYECIRGINQYKALDIRLFPIHLIELAIWECDFQEDPMPVIQNLKDLKKLELFNGQHYKKQLSSSARGFPRLEYLELQNLKSLEEWKVEKGGMPLLKEISINVCTDLVAIPELQHMTRLNNLFLMDVHQDLCEKLLGEESYKLRHIPSVQIK
ncbi:hypothetical protein LUZ62_053678 [Rhynchospora pubera]|uniref:Uncharacterized protein n=1 Tax=Rhynchospora pubera TaxID=906938 RepID=A0AAV8DTB2_9POAL|nr:hypothetical protein LUZ62_053678 [Rhynchospora pubera]